MIRGIFLSVSSALAGSPLIRITVRNLRFLYPQDTGTRRTQVPTGHKQGLHGAPVYDHALYASDIVLRWIDTWMVAYKTLCAYGLDGITYTQTQVDKKVELARKKKAEELAAKIEELKKEAEKELDAKISQIQHDMPTKRRNKKTRQ